MLEEGVQTLINNNASKNSSLDSTPKENFKKLTPNKFTFLKSNQLITKYVKQGNVLQNSASMHSKSSVLQSSYDLCREDMKEFHQKVREKENLNEKIAWKVKKNCKKARIQKRKKQQDLQNKIKKIEIMIQATHFKSADIMYGRNASNYTRKQADYDEMNLKEMKDNTCDKSLKKVESTRKMMLNKSQKIIEKMPSASQKELELSLISDSFSNFSNSSEMIYNSLIKSQKQRKSKQSKDQQTLKKLITNYSFDQAFNAKRRNACSEGFAMCWKLGNNDKKSNSNKMFQNLKKTSRTANLSRKSIQQKSSLIQRISDQDKCEVSVNKKFHSAFNRITDKFDILQIN